MKLLFDQNISFRVVRHLLNLFPDSKQVRELGLENTQDKEIWNYAKEANFSIVTFDADFYDLVTLHGHPPKIIWLRMGNTSTNNLIKTIESHNEIIKSFISDINYHETGCLEINEL